MAARKPDVNRQLLIQCEPCDYRLRGSRTQLERGIPVCPCCGARMVSAAPSTRDVVAASLLTPAHGSYL